MLNAGICGLIEFLKRNYAVEDVDYKIENQNLYLSIDYLKNNDIPKMYVETMADKFEKTTKFYRIISKKANVDKIYAIKEKNDKNIADLKKEYSDLYTMLSKKSYTSLYTVWESYGVKKGIGLCDIDAFNKEKDEDEKYKKYCDLINSISEDKVKSLLIYTELIYTYFKLFFNENPMSKKITCLCDNKKSFYDVYSDNFFEPLLNEIEVDEKKKKTRCIECLNGMFTKKEFTFLVDTANDVKRKTSYFWNYDADAYVCPVCSFVYSFIPMGFVLCGQDALFINSNNSINSMLEKNSVLGEKVEDETTVRRRILRVFTEEKIDALNNISSNLQVIMRSPEYAHFKFDVIDKNIIYSMHEGKKYFKNLENKYYVIKGKNDIYISVYDMVMDAVLRHENLHGIIDKMFKFEIGKDKSVNYLMNVLKLEIIFYGGKSMDDLKKKVDFSFQSGKALRKCILGENAFSQGEEDDNKLRGIVYKLINLSASGNRTGFMDAVIRIYSGFNLTIPSVFKDCYLSDEMFHAIAHGFILGLKYVKYNSNNEEDNKNE
jgi:CRISPR-associated protein Cst1